RAAGLHVGTSPTGAPILPFQVEFRSRDVVGPSGGLVYALLISDMLAPGDLAAGRVLAATGTIDVNGDVGLVGGIAEKAVGARRTGRAWLLLPVAQMGDVDASRLTVIGVE